MLIWFHNMRGLEKFLLGASLPLGVLLLFTAISGLDNVPRVFPTVAPVSAQSCSPVAPCSAIGCGNSDSCGNYCGDCPTTPQSGTTKSPTTTTKSNESVPLLSGLGEIKNSLAGINANFIGEGLKKLITGIIQNLITALSNIIGGDPNIKPPVSMTPGVSNPNETLSYMYERYGALGAIGLGVQEMYDKPPVTTADYLATIDPIAPAFAQDSKDGRAVLYPLRGYWEASRNLAYIFFVLVLVAIGLMIMFRSKIDPRTTVTVTAALPNLVVSLILITFSLALAGFIIDIGRIFMELVKSILGGAVTGNQPLPGLKEGFVDLSTSTIWKSFILNLNGGVSFGGIGGSIVGFFVSLIVMFFALVVGIQVFIMLLFRYINLILKPIFAPFVFLFGALPGRGGNAGNWFKGYLVDALTFPLVFLVLNLALSIKNTSDVVSNDPFGVFIGGAQLNSIVAIGVLFMATKIPALLEDAMDIKPSGHVDKSGSQPGQMLKQVPIVKNLL